MPETDEKTDRAIAPIGKNKPAEEHTAAQPAALEPREDGDDATWAEDYERLLDMYDVSFKNFAEGEMVKGIVLQVSDSKSSSTSAASPRG